MRVHRDDGSIAPVERLLGRTLDVEIDRQAQVFAGHGELLAKHAELFAVRVHDHVARAVGAAQDRVVGFLHARATDHVAGRVGGVAVVIGEHLLGHLAHVADQVRGEAVFGVEPALLVQRFELGQLVAVRFNEGLLVWGDVLLERDGLILGRGGKTLQRRFHGFGRQIEPTRNERDFHRGIVHLLAQQVAGGRRIVVDQQAAFAIEQPPARRKHRHLADAVLLGKRAVVVGIEHLQTPQAEHQDAQNRNDDILRGMQLGGRDFVLPLVVGPGTELNQTWHLQPV